MATYSLKKLIKAIHAISIKEGDILFVNRHMIDMEVLSRSKFPKDTPEMMIIGVDVKQGMSVKDTLYKMGKDEIAELLKRE